VLQVNGLSKLQLKQAESGELFRASERVLEVRADRHEASCGLPETNSPERSPLKKKKSGGEKHEAVFDRM
jgi:hypothetical protein